MKERVNTGGLRSFGVSREKLDEARAKDIEQAYEKARLRKRRNKIILWIVILAVVGGISIYLFN